MTRICIKCKNTFWGYRLKKSRCPSCGGPMMREIRLLFQEPVRSNRNKSDHNKKPYKPS